MNLLLKHLQTAPLLTISVQTELACAEFASPSSIEIKVLLGLSLSGRIGKMNALFLKSRYLFFETLLRVDKIANLS